MALIRKKNANSFILGIRALDSFGSTFSVWKDMYILLYVLKLNIRILFVHFYNTVEDDGSFCNVYIVCFGIGPSHVKIITFFDV